jgi:hypothetical protein
MIDDDDDGMMMMMMMMMMLDVVSCCVFACVRACVLDRTMQQQQSSERQPPAATTTTTTYQVEVERTLLLLVAVPHAQAALVLLRAIEKVLVLVAKHGVRLHELLELARPAQHRRAAIQQCRQALVRKGALRALAPQIRFALVVGLHHHQLVNCLDRRRRTHVLLLLGCCALLCLDWMNNVCPKSFYLE